MEVKHKLVPVIGACWTSGGLQSAKTRDKRP